MFSAPEIPKRRRKDGRRGDEERLFLPPRNHQICVWLSAALRENSLVVLTLTKYQRNPWTAFTIWVFRRKKYESCQWIL